MRSGIVCSGVSCVDLLLYGTEPLATRESLSMVRETQYRPGGATSNTGRALARLGMPVEYMTVIGADANGDILLKLWEADGVDTRYVIRSHDAGTALSTVPVYADGKRGVYFCPGTNDTMGIDNIFGPRGANLSVLSERQAFHIGYPPLMRRLQGEQLADLLSLVHGSGVLVSLDTTPIPDDTTLRGMLVPALGTCHLFTPNIEEASQITGRFSALAARAREATAQSGEAMEIEDIITPEELTTVGEELLGLGVPIVVITLGANGAFLCTGDAETLRSAPLAPADLAGWADQRLYIPSFQVDGPINTAGAGDAFIAGILTGMCYQLPSLGEIVTLAHASSALHCDLNHAPCTYAQVHTELPGMRRRQPKNSQLPNEPLDLTAGSVK
ncbi:MAG: carbohydrate kinase family protein [Armatimonadota bacterium]